MEINGFWKFVVFCFVGAGAFLIDLGVFNIFYKIIGIFEIAITISFIVSMIFNFSVNRNLTFRARGQSVLKQAPKWLLVYVVAFFARLILGKIIIMMLGNSVLTANIAFISGLAISIPISFLGSLYWAFKK